MSEDFSIPAPAMTAWEIEHIDPWDDAERLTELLEARIAEKEAECEFCRLTPCDCEPIRQDEFRQMAARHDEGPARRRP